MTTSTSTPHPTPAGHSAPAAANQVQVRCLKCNYLNLWDTRFCGQCGAWLGDAKKVALLEARRMVASHPDLHSGTHDRSVGFYLMIFLALGFATVVEIFVIQLFRTRQDTLTPIGLIGLFTMATAKFLLVAMFFMHLKGDKRFYTVFFSVGFFFAACVLLALQALFHL